MKIIKQIPVGTILSDLYRVDEHLGKGGYGNVYACTQLSTGQKVALKMLSPETDGSAFPKAQQLARFQREVSLCAGLHHPNIVQILDKDHTDDDTLFIVFEYVPGITLKAHLKKKQHLSAMETGEIMAQVLEALAHAHKQGVIHRDLKPANIMINETATRCHVKILDFGLATLVEEARPTSYESLTLPHQTVGTPSYCAPEQLKGDPPTPSSDLYAWGLLFLECLTGHPTFSGANLAEVYHKQLSPREVPLPAAVAAHPLGHLLRRVLKKAHRERCADPTEIWHTLTHMQLGDLVGEIPSPVLVGSTGESTNPSRISSGLYNGEKRQVTILCISLTVTGDKEPDLETLNEILKVQLPLCSEISEGFGGHVNGALGDRLVICFGYPLATDADARLAGRTALEVAEAIRNRNLTLKRRQGITLSLQGGIHTGQVIIGNDGMATGPTANAAIRLETLAAPGTFLVSASSHALLKQHLEFEKLGEHRIGGTPRTMATYRLMGEAMTEALSLKIGGTQHSALIGRASEFTVLKALWQETIKGRSRCLMLTGDAGIGKSRLVQELQRHALSLGHTIQEGRCLPEHRNNALFPVIQIVRHHLNLQKEKSPEELLALLETTLKSMDCPLDQAIPIASAWFSLPMPKGYKPSKLSPDRQKSLLLETLLALFHTMGKGSPLLLIIEDLHWVDPTTLTFLNDLLLNDPGQKTLVILTSRPEFSAPWSKKRATPLVLNGLSTRAATALIHKVARGKKVSEEVVNHVITRTDGVPLFIEELTGMLMDAFLVEKNGEYTFKEEVQSASIPITLRDLLTSRMDRLGPARETLQLASVIGREFDYDLLTAASLIDETTIQLHMDELVHAGLIYRQLKMGPPLYMFHHALIRDAACNTMLIATRQACHARIVRILQHRYDKSDTQQIALVAAHHAGAGQYWEAVTFGTDAARALLDKSVHSEALNHANLVTEWIQKLPKKRRDAPALEINEIRTQALMASVGWAHPHVKACVDHSRALLMKLGPGPHSIPTLWSLITYHHVAGNRYQVKTLTDELMDIAKTSEEDGLTAAAYSLKGQADFMDGNYADADRVLEKSMASYDYLKHCDHGKKYGIDTLVWTKATLSVVRWFRGDLTSATTLSEASVSWAKAIDHIPSLGIALLYQGMLFQLGNDKKNTERVSLELIELSKHYGLPAYQGYANIHYAWAIDDISLLNFELDKLRKLGCILGFTRYESLLADINANQGNIALAIDTIDRCIDMCHEMNEYYCESYLYLKKTNFLKDHRIGSATDLLNCLSETIVKSDYFGTTGIKNIANNINTQIC